MGMREDRMVCGLLRPRASTEDFHAVQWTDFGEEQAMSTMVSNLRRPSPFAIRVQAAEIRCGWNRNEHDRRRKEAQRRQEKLFRLVVTTVPFALNGALRATHA
jgi:hypothetical protein